MAGSRALQSAPRRAPLVQVDDAEDDGPESALQGAAAHVLSQTAEHPEYTWALACALYCMGNAGKPLLEALTLVSAPSTSVVWRKGPDAWLTVRQGQGAITIVVFVILVKPVTVP